MTKSKFLEVYVLLDWLIQLNKTREDCRAKPVLILRKLPSVFFSKISGIFAINVL